MTVVIEEVVKIGRRQLDILVANVKDSTLGSGDIPSGLQSFYPEQGLPYQFFSLLPFSVFWFPTSLSLAPYKNLEFTIRITLTVYHQMFERTGVMGGDSEGTAPQNFEVGDGICIRPPNTWRSVVKYEHTKKDVKRKFVV